MKLPLARIAEFISALPADPTERGSRTGYSIDSRTVQPGELFFAVKGERLDGHDFVERRWKGRCRRSRSQGSSWRAMPTRLACWRSTIRLSRCNPWPRPCASFGESR